MNNKIAVVFAFMSLVLFLGIVIEVVNPHTFLLTTGAFVRAFTLFVLVAVWVWFSKKNEGRFLISGSVLLLFAGCVYFLYGISSYCGSVYYEETDHYRNVSQEYSCTRILQERLLGR